MPYKLTFKDDSNGYLEHFGVKGMHWGVWNEETRARRMGLHKRVIETSSENQKGLSDKQKKAIMVGAAVTAGVLAAAGGIYVGKMLSGTWYGVSTISSDPLKNYIEKMDDTPVSLKKGTKIQHISGSRIEDFRKKGELYVSYKLKDNAKYMDRLPHEDWLKDGDVYKQTWKAVKEIKAPSRKEAAQIYLKVAGSDVKQVEFKRFMENGIRTRNNDPLRDQFVSELKARGYNALIDENDAVWTNKPLILIDPQNTVSMSGSRKINPLDKIVAVYLK